MSTEPPTRRNRLAAASSPYLRMHAGNPVHWQPWDAIALQHARDTDTPILLSIGYSACHWCHVMAHECFENAPIAAAMNQGFVNIKLDREERPDIDRVYQLAHQALRARGGGWPLTAFLDPQDLAPFYIGTYFPPTPRHGLPGFPEVLRKVRAYFDSHRSELHEQAHALQDWLQRIDRAGTGPLPDAEATAAEALRRIAARFDADRGGNQGAPKFPRALEIEWLLDQPRSAGAGKMARLTLARMATRGLQDHLGGGFFRYCVDADWTVPHFEKMLYDNAQLLPAYARVAASTPDDTGLHATTTLAVHGIVDWLACDMTAPDGAFYSAISADSEGIEGRFYLWTREEVRAALPDGAYPLAAAAFGLDASPNFEGRAWHLLRVAPLAELATRTEREPAQVEREYQAIRRALIDARERRTPPMRDDKVLTAWNALAIAGLARTARLLDDDGCAAMAFRALDALHGGAWIDGTLFANVAAPDARIPGFLDDHAFLLDALLETLQLRFNRRDLDWATALADALLAHFADPDHGDFRFSTPAHATPLARSREFTDDALPNGNGIAILGLLRLGHLTGEVRYLDTAERALKAAAGALQQYPDACLGVLRALHEFAHPRTQVVVRCPAGAVPAWRRAALRTPAPDRGTAPTRVSDAFIIPEAPEALPGLLAERTLRAPAGTAYVCSGLVCEAPVTTPAALAAAIRGAGQPA